MPKTSSTKKTRPKRHHKSSHALIKLGLIAGILMLVLLPVATLKLAAWKMQIEQSGGDMLLALKRGTGLKFGGPFSLVDQNGNKVTDAGYRGKYLLVYFGYTYCPDLCPVALQGIAETLDELGPDASKVQALFITIDPERDTPEKLKEYTASFHPGIVGLTGSPQQIKAAAKAFNVAYSKTGTKDGGDYHIDHTTSVFVINPEGRPVAKMDMEESDPAEVAAMLRNMCSGTPKPGK